MISPNPFGIGENLLSSEEIKQRLHRFNLNNDWSVFKDVPECQQVSIMYPTVFRTHGQTDQEYKDQLVKLFGPLKETT